jgi:hypothetical protein
MLQKMMIILVAGVGIAIGSDADASVRGGHRGGAAHVGKGLHYHRHLAYQRHFAPDWSFDLSYWDDHNCSVPYYYNQFGSWNGFGCFPRH